MASFASPLVLPLGGDGDDACETCYTTTVAQMLTRVRERADMVGSSFVSDSTLLDWINEAHQKLHGMCVEALGEEYIAKIASFTTDTEGQINFELACCFYKLYGVDLEINGRIVSLKPYNRAERNFFRNSTPGSSYEPRFLLSGGYLRLLPAPPVGLTGQVLFAPEATLLSDPANSVKYPNGWERFIVIDAAIQALAKEESSVTTLSNERELIVREIKEAKELRDLSAPRRVVDLDRTELDYWERDGF